MILLNELRTVAGNLVKIGQLIARPVIEKRTGLKVISEGANLGEIVTDLDIGISRAILDGVPDHNIFGLRHYYSGSFSEEDDSSKRRTALEIYQIDPLDGTGDFKKTHGSDSVMPPTLLITKLKRESANLPFQAIGAIIYDLVNEYGILSDGSQIQMFEARTDHYLFSEMSWSRTQIWPWHSPKQIFAVGLRESYPQDVRDGKFIEFLRDKGFRPELVKTGGAGMQALQFFRNFMQPTGHTPGAIAFGNLKPLDIIFNAQPDWKTWDVDPINVVARALGVGFPTDIFGRSLEANAVAVTMRDMWHRQGCVFTASIGLSGELEKAANEFHVPGDPERDLLSINY